MSDGGGFDDLLTELAADLVDRNKGVGALVDIGSNDDHERCLLSSEVDEAKVGPAGRTHLSGGGATLLSSHAGRSFPPGIGTTAECQPAGGSVCKSQIPGEK
ncbi:hypothetical protein MTY81_58990 [Mycolicibacterium sp. TY81]|nr:hypothetical protein MTY81_58990 [Mycolicibacterium sp. TY81]